MIERFQFNDEAGAALAQSRPIVALESTLITHGLPYPQNIQTAQAMEQAVRAGGAAPATIAILQGRVHIGLTAGQLEYLATRPMERVRKCSRRDLPIALANREDGATTVAGTMILAHLAGLEIFATGGIGGVHRGNPFDVSADLIELGRTPVTVVCSGAKSILDLPATREVLETQGVPIVGYGAAEMPAFFSRRSGLSVDVQLDDVAAIARLIEARRSLGLQSGILVTVPVPAGDEFDPRAAEAATRQATREAEEEGLHGPAVTPWILRRVAELTGGDSLRANQALLRHNALVAGKIAAILTDQSRPDYNKALS